MSSYRIRKTFSLIVMGCLVALLPRLARLSLSNNEPPSQSNTPAHTSMAQKHTASQGSQNRRARFLCGGASIRRSPAPTITTQKVSVSVALQRFLFIRLLHSSPITKGAKCPLFLCFPIMALKSLIRRISYYTAEYTRTYRKPPCGGSGRVCEAFTALGASFPSLWRLLVPKPHCLA